MYRITRLEAERILAHPDHQPDYVLHAARDALAAPKTTDEIMMEKLESISDRIRNLEKLLENR